MKYLLIITIFLLNTAFAESNSSLNAENCAHATQDIHTVSNTAYDRLLAQLNQNDTEEEDRTTRTRPTKGQR